MIHDLVLRECGVDNRQTRADKPWTTIPDIEQFHPIKEIIGERP
jgi:hypothetical protein